MKSKEEILQNFIEVLSIPGESMNEKKVADYLVEKLSEMGFEIVFDHAHKEIGGNVGNLIAYWPGTDPEVEPLFLSCHMDTVFPIPNLKTRIVGDRLCSDGTTILGTDDRSAMAAYLEAIRTIQEEGVRCGPIELICTISEQRGLLGAFHLDSSLVKSHYGYVFDHDGDFGEQLVTKAAYSYHITFKLCGPTEENGHFVLNTNAFNAFLLAGEFMSRVPLGDINEDCKANVGMIKGGELTTIVPASVTLYGEVRAYTENALWEQLNIMKQLAEEICEAHGGHAEVEIDKRYTGYHLEKDHPLVKNAAQASEAMGLEYYYDSSMGGADSNALREKGLEAMTMGCGFKLIHTTDEYVTLKNVYNGGAYVLELIRNWYQTHKK